jgi:hypothetical protein
MIRLTGRTKGLLILLTLAALSTGAWFIIRAANQPRITFYGMVIDERGQPVTDATVHLIADEFHFGKGRFGQLVPGSANDCWLRTDAAGRFHVHDMPGNHLTIMDVSKPGYDWIFDWAYAATELPDGNRFYLFEPNVRTYLPDQSRPAIFPLVRAGSQVLGQPSRGGSDRYSDGRVVQNGPVVPLIPSAGLSAPSTPLERDERLLKLSGRSRPPWMSTTSAATKPQTRPTTQEDQLPL